MRVANEHKQLGNSIMTQSPHLIPLPQHPNIALWKWFCIRSAGFPAHQVLDLAVTPETIALTKLYQQAQADYEETNATAINTIQSLNNQAPKTERKPFQKALHQLKQHRLPTLNLPILEQLQQTQQHLTQLGQQFEQAMIAEGQRLNETLRSIFQQPLLQEALVWQNRSAFKENEGWLEWFFQQSYNPNRRFRDIECLLSNYLQRYCLKNDTIGFFGPMGWGQFCQTETTMTYHHGETLLTQRQLYFEHWSIEALANTLNQQTNLRPYLCPRPLPFFYIENKIVHLPIIAAWLRDGKLPPLVQSSFPLTAIQQQVLLWCDGQHTAQAIAKQATIEFNLTEKECYELLNQWVKWGILAWGIAIPLALNPEKSLRHQLAQVTDELLQNNALASLQQLETIVQKIQQSVGQPQALHVALEELESTFTQLTDQSSTRNPGQYYAGRTLVYEECRRNLELTLGRDILSQLGPPLGLLLTSARWFTYRVAELYLPALTEIYETLTQTIGSSTVDFYSFSVQATSLLQNSDNPLLRQATQELSQKWANILNIAANADTNSLHYCYIDLEIQVKKAFHAPHSGWQLARYCSPDVMVAASDQAAIQQGNYDLVLGELHLFNNLARTLFASQHPNPSELAQARQLDLPQPCIIPIPSKDWNTARYAIALTASHDIWFAYDTTASKYAHQPTVTLGELVVEQTASGLQIRTRDNRHSFEIIDFFGYTLSNLCLNFPSIMPSLPHVPRISFDRLVISRERWNFQLAEISWTEILTRPEQFLAAQQWRQTHQLPRFIFVAMPTEPKPFFVDFHSPLSLDVLARAARRSVKATNTVIHITEMYPDFDQLWLTDNQNNHYTSELRLVALV